MNVAESDAVGSKTEVAVTVTEGFDGTVGGALYWTELGVWSVSVPARHAPGYSFGYSPRRMMDVRDCGI